MKATTQAAQFGIPQVRETGETKEGRNYKISECVTRDGKTFWRFQTRTVTMTSLAYNHKTEFWTLEDAQTEIARW
jgi:hypothetical protein